MRKADIRYELWQKKRPTLMYVMDESNRIWPNEKSPSMGDYIYVQIDKEKPTYRRYTKMVFGNWANCLDGVYNDSVVGFAHIGKVEKSEMAATLRNLEINGSFDDDYNKCNELSLERDFYERIETVPAVKLFLSIVYKDGEIYINHYSDKDSALSELQVEVALHKTNGVEDLRFNIVEVNL